ncbi:MAG TPA: protein kinase [Terriglobales bacterium]|nr:protein kinase [Terriglobales bacterium]
MSVAAYSEGTRFGRYQISALLGSGGMGQVYRARDTRLSRDVALKILHAESGSARGGPAALRFEREARAASALNHPNIVAIFDIGTENDTTYIIMELVHGRSLRQRLETSNLAFKAAMDIASQVADGLTAAHRAGITHRDLKPENVMISDEGQVKVLDFGLAKTFRDEAGEHGDVVTQTGTIPGTIGYMSPEQARDLPVDFRSDQFSFGILLYEMVLGVRPFSRPSVAETLSAILTEPCPPIPDWLPERFRQVMQRCLAKQPQDRYASTAALRDEVRALRELDVVVPADRNLVASPTRAVSSSSTKTRKMTALAVLPFLDMSPEQDQEYFCDGVAEEIISALAKVENLRVVSRSSSFVFRGKTPDLKLIGEKLGVESVLEGSVRRAGNRLRITARLTNIADGFQVWGEKYDSLNQDIFDVQDDISRSIVAALRLKLGGDEEAELLKRHTQNVEAYHLYLRGRYNWNRRVPDAIRKAHTYFQEALTEDPGYAQAYVGLADCFIMPHYYGLARAKDVIPQARAAVEKALALDPDLAEAHASLAMITATHDFRFLQAEKHFRRAYELNPGYPFAPMWYALFDLVPMARHAEALTQCKIAKRLDPLSAVIATVTGTTLHYQGRFAEAEDELHRALEVDSAFPVAHYYLGKNYAEKGAHELALKELQTADQSLGFSPSAIANLGFHQATWGDRAGAQQCLDRLHAASANRYVPALAFSHIYAGLGETGRALDLLEQSLEERTGLMIWLKVDNIYRPLRESARFSAVLSGMGLNDSALSTLTS